MKKLIVLYDCSLKWLQAKGRGLGFRNEVLVGPKDHLAPIYERFP